jgi:hypothetical protein
MRNIFLYRPFEAENLKDELDAAQKAGFTLIKDRADLRAGDRILPRFYPFYNYLVDEFNEIGAELISDQHDWSADIRQWVSVLGDLTPKTWESIEDVEASGYNGPFFVKGIDKSLKIDFKRFCYAENFAQLPTILANLKEALPIEQPLVIREFKPLATYGVSPVSGMPIAHEFRCFIYRGQFLTSGFYWDSVRKQDGIKDLLADPPMEFINRAIAAVGDKVNFYSLDVALTKKGEWIVIEINDGCLSGLSANDPVELYQKLYQLI